MRFADISFAGCLGMEMEELMDIRYSLRLQLWDFNLISSKNPSSY
jgi:hypothetical protein